MLLAAAEEFDIELTESWLVGDSARDIDAGKSAGCTTILIENAAHNRTLEPGATAPDYTAVNIKEVANIIKKHYRTKKMETENIETTHDRPKSEPKVTPLTPDRPAQQKNQRPVIKEPTQEQLLKEILEQLKKNQRTEMFGEFSVTRLIAGIVQVIVLFCLLISIWLLMSPAKQLESLFISLGFATVFQVMALTFFIMQERK
jgi:hypothetical protein